MTISPEKATQPITERAAECIERCLYHSRRTHPNLTEARKWNVRLLREHIEEGDMTKQHIAQAVKTICHLEDQA